MAVRFSPKTYVGMCEHRSLNPVAWNVYFLPHYIDFSFEVVAWTHVALGGVKVASDRIT